ncbi:MAG TPA: MFS transporter [Sphingobium sp.]
MMASRAFEKVSYDGLPAAIILALLATAGVQFGLIMAVFVASLEHSLGFSAKQAGAITTAGLAGAAIGALIAAIFGPRLPWRRTCAWLLLGTIACELLSAMLGNFIVIALVRGAIGVAGGLLIGFSYALIARRTSPDATFAILFFGQIAFGGIGSMLAPIAIDRFGLPAMYIGFAILPAIALLTLRFLPDFPVRSLGPAKPSERIGRSWAVASAILGLTFFQFTRSLIAAHLVSFGTSVGIDRSGVLAGVAVATFTGAAGAIGAAAIGNRFGRVLPLLLGTGFAWVSVILLLLLGHQAMFVHPSVAIWIGILVLQTVADSFVLPYYFAVCAIQDAEGRTAVWAGFMSKIGLSFGPLLGAILIAEFHFGRWLLSGMALTIVAGILSIGSAITVSLRSNRLTGALSV